MVQKSSAIVRFIGKQAEGAQQLSWLLSNTAPMHFTLEHIHDLHEFLNKGISRDGDVILLDVTQDAECQFEMMTVLHQKLSNSPIVVLTGDDEEIGREAIRRGAQDYLVKAQLTTDSMSRSLLNAVQRHEIHRRDSQAAPLLDSATAVLNRLPIGVILVTADSKILFLMARQKPI